MKILSYNINNDYRDLRDKSSKIVELILETDPDIIGLQEVIPEMYDLLFKELNGIYTFSNKKTHMFFNVMMTKHRLECDIKTIPFDNTSMNRDFIVALSPLNSGVTFINTHLESCPISSPVRKKQLDEILMYKNIILFGDLNFTNEDECAGSLKYLKQSNDDYYTYDCKYNMNAYTYRTNLDRFYTDIDFGSRVNVLEHDRTSDHFPLLLRTKKFL
jgi:endonuclease/exonuclease/phosphatase family metal-dependent hydrolase